MKIVNFDKKQYLSPEAFGNEPTLQGIAESRDGVMQGLLVLCADGNNRGGGDLRSSAEIIGSWVGDRVAIVSSTVCSTTLSEPGLEDIPLLTQILHGGTDVSDQVIAAILEGEGADSALNGLPADVSLRLMYRKVFGDALANLKPDEQGRHLPITSPAHLVESIGGKVEETFLLTMVKLAEHVNRIAEAFALPVRWTLTQAPKQLAQADLAAEAVVFTSNAGDTARFSLDFSAPSMTVATVLVQFHLNKVLEPYVVNKSGLPSAVAKIVNDTLAAMNRKGGQ